MRVSVPKVLIYFTITFSKVMRVPLPPSLGGAQQRNLWAVCEADLEMHGHAFLQSTVEFKAGWYSPKEAGLEK